MFRLLLKTTVFVCLVLNCEVGIGRTGNEGAHAGDIYADEFFELGQMLSDLLKTREMAELVGQSGFSAEEFALAVRRTKIFSREPGRVQVDNHSVSGSNYENGGPILIDRKDWREGRIIQRLRLVLHEYFGIMNVERDHYNVSVRFIAALEQLASRLLERNAHNALFYGVAVASPPLNFMGSVCANSEAWFLTAKKYATDQSRNRCLIDKPKVGCENFAVLTQEIRSERMPGLSFCEITVVGR